MVLAGGSGRRLGSVDKPALLVAGRASLLDIALAAVAPARIVVVGPPRQLPSGVLQTVENPPGGGPAAGLVAGLTALGLLGLQDSVRASDQGSDEQADASGLVVVLAADLPGIRAWHVRTLTAALVAAGADGAVLTDPAGRPQYLAGVWRSAALARAASARNSWQGGRVSDLLGPLIGVRVPGDRPTTADVDTTADLLEWHVQSPPPDEPG